MGPPNQKAYRKENENVSATDIQVELGQTTETAETGIKRYLEEREDPWTYLQSFKELCS